MFNPYDEYENWVPATPREHLAHFLSHVEDFDVLNALSESLHLDPFLFTDEMNDDAFSGAIDSVAKTVEQEQCFGAAISAVVKELPEVQARVPHQFLKVVTDAQRNRSGEKGQPYPHIFSFVFCSLFILKITCFNFSFLHYLHFSLLSSVVSTSCTSPTSLHPRDRGLLSSLLMSQVHCPDHL
jgi:hypothetical protein